METPSRSWVLRRNCVMTPRQLLVAFVVIGAGTLVVSSAWALSGAWLVIPFMLLEIGALALAFVVYCRHARDHERITLEPSCVCVEVVRGATSDRRVIPRDWLRCQFDDTRKGLIRLVSPKQELEVGQFVDQTGRRKFYDEFRAALRGCATPG